MSSRAICFRHSRRVGDVEVRRIRGLFAPTALPGPFEPLELLVTHIGVLRPDSVPNELPVASLLRGGSRVFDVLLDKAEYLVGGARSLHLSPAICVDARLNRREERLNDSSYFSAERQNSGFLVKL